MAGLKLFCIAVVSMLLFSSAVDAAVTCGLVTGCLAPCVPYARSGTGSLPYGCCSGIQRLNNAARTTPDRQTACRCMEEIARALKGIDYGVVAGIPGKCGVPIPYKLSPYTDCSKVM